MAEWYQQKQKKVNADQIIDLYNQGYGKDEIAKKTGLSSRTIYDVVNKNGFSFKETGIKMTEKEKEEFELIRLLAREALKHPAAIERWRKKRNVQV